MQQVDGLGRVVTTITNYQDGAGAADAPVDQDRTTRTVYDAAGRRIATVDPGGRETRFAYDLRDTLIVVTENATDGDCPTEPCNVVTQYQYDRAGNRVAVIDARGITTRQTTYDAADRLVTMTDGLGQTTGYQYDRGGRRIGTSDPRGPANDVTITYDDQDRRTGQTATNLDAPIHMAYDVLGRRTTVSDGTGTTSVTHDALGRITRVTAPETGTVAYGYNARGQRTQLTSPDGTTISYQYDPDGALHQVRQDGTPLATYAYDAAGRLASVSRANGAVTTDAYDGADRLRDRHTTVDGTTVSRYQYTVDRLGLRTAVTETLTTQTRTIAYTYDGLNRLIGADETPGTTYAYAYDLAGNRTATWENGAQTQDLAYNAANQVIGWTYDAAGNRLSDGTTTATYDALNRLTQQDGTSYIYNADGVLVSDGTTTYTQDLAAPLAQILADGSATYVYGAGSERLRAVDGPWYLADALGSVRTTLDDAGAVVATASYDPWGVPQSDLLGPFGFTGELHHGDQVYLRARWYAPGSGTFPTRDPFAGFPEMPYSLHAYQYAYSAPTMWTDPSGEVIGDACTPPYAWHAEEKLCVLSSDVPPWLRFLPEKRDPTFAIPAPMLVGSAPGAVGQLGGRSLGHLGREGWEACINLIGGTLVWMLTQTHVETQTRRDDEHTDIVVELGYGSRLDNLITLANYYPNAKVYGIDNRFHGSARALALLGYDRRIELLNADYTQYNGPLKNQADVVVSVAPQPGSVIDQGIERFIKPGGSVVILVASLDTGLRDDLKNKYGTKATMRQLTIDPYAVPGPGYSGGGTVTTAIGIPLTSLHFTVGQRPWEIFIQSW